MSKFVLSDERINSYGFKVRTSGIDLTDFKDNPVMLYEHERRDLVGHWKDLETEGERLLAVPDFDLEDELGKRVAGKVERGILKGASIGLQIAEISEEIQDDGAVVPVVSKSKLVEASLTALPSNSNALRLYDQTGKKLSEQEIKLSITSTQSQQTQNDKSMSLSKENLQALGLQEGHTQEQLNEAISKKLQELSTLQKEQKERNETQAKSLVDDAIKAGKITADQKESFLSLARQDYDNARSILDGMQPAKKPTEALSREQTDDRSSWTLSDWRKKDMAGLHKMKQDQPEEYKALLSKSNVKNHIQ